LLVQPLTPAPLHTPPLFTPLSDGGRFAPPFGPGPTGFSMAPWGSPTGYRSAPGSSGFTVLQGARPSNPPCGSAWESYYRHKGW
jgi:hypothetical protein